MFKLKHELWNEIYLWLLLYYFITTYYMVTWLFEMWKYFVSFFFLYILLYLYLYYYFSCFYLKIRWNIITKLPMSNVIAPKMIALSYNNDCNDLWLTICLNPSINTFIHTALGLFVSPFFRCPCSALKPHVLKLFSNLNNLLLLYQFYLWILVNSI